MRSGSDGPICTAGVQTVRSGSDRFDLTRTRPMAGRSPEIGFRGGASPDLLKSDARGSKLLELGSGMAYATWVIHLGLLRGLGGL
jgi:hypothetical protein